MGSVSGYIQPDVSHCSCVKTPQLWLLCSILTSISPLKNNTTTTTPSGFSIPAICSTKFWLLHIFWFPFYWANKEEGVGLRRNRGEKLIVWRGSVICVSHSKSLTSFKRRERNTRCMLRQTWQNQELNLKETDAAFLHKCTVPEEQPQNVKCFCSWSLLARPLW